MPKGYRSGFLLTNENGDALYGFNGSFRHDYLTFNILYHALLGEKIKFSATVGPYFAFNSGNFNYLPNGYPIRGWYKAANVRPFDLGLTFSLGCYVPIYKGLDFNFGLNNDIGFLSINPRYFFNTSTHLFNSTLVLGFNYRFGRFL